MHNLANSFCGTEASRGCGSRKKGALYIVSKRLFLQGCGKMPFPIGKCKYCSEGLFKDSLRVPKFVDSLVLHEFVKDKTCDQKNCGTCPISKIEGIGQVILWGVGEKYYPTPEDFTKEAMSQGVCKRIARVPSEIESEGIENMSEFMCFLVHPKACQMSSDQAIEFGYEDEKIDLKKTVDNLWKGEATYITVNVPGVFLVFRPQEIEYVTDEEGINQNEQKIKNLKERGIKIVEFPPSFFKEGGEDD